MSGDQFSLCWNNFHNNLTTGFHSLLQSEDLVDVTLAAEGRYLKAHKIVLSVCSQYFKELFRVNPCKHPIVILKDVSYNSLRDLLQFMYQGEVSVSQEELSTLMKVAEMLQIKGLTEETMQDSSHTNQNGVKEIKLIDVQSLAEPRGMLKRSNKPTKKFRPDIPRKIPKIDDNIESSLLTPMHTSNDTDIDHETSTSLLVEPDILEPIKPKIEPEDPSDFSEHSLEIDMSSMVDTSMGESSSQSSICWKSENPKTFLSSDTNTPGLFKFTKSRKGMPHLILDSNLFRPSGKIGSRLKNHKYWECVQNRKTGCKARCLYTNQIIELKSRVHNHLPPIEYIQRREAQGATYYLPLSVDYEEKHIIL